LTFNYEGTTVVSGANNFVQNQLGAGPVTITISGNITNATATIPVTGSLIGLAPGMTVTTTNAAVFPTTTIITSIGPGLATGAAQITVNPVPQANLNPATITATLPGPPKPNFARIYAFSFEGAIYTLPRPSMFLVHGPGQPVDITAATGAGFQAAPGIPTTPTAVTQTPIGRSTTDVSGVVAREWEFSALDPVNPNKDLRYWEYEKGDFSIRLDSEAGQFEQILLAAALRAGADMADRSGASLGVRSGASLAGASLAGASLSGASVSGASLSGASLRNGR
jgi:Pentapeptide repeats (8 copies)